MGKFKVGDVITPVFLSTRQFFRVDQVRNGTYVLTRIFPYNGPSHFSETQLTESHYSLVETEELTLLRVLNG